MSEIEQQSDQESAQNSHSPQSATVASNAPMKSVEHIDADGTENVPVTPLKRLKDVKSLTNVIDGASDQMTNDDVAECSSKVHIRRVRRRCRRHRQTASCSHDRQVYAQDRYGVLFEHTNVQSTVASPVAMARDLRYGSEEVQSFEPLDMSKYALPDDRPPIQKHQLLDTIYNAQLHNLNAHLNAQTSASSGPDSLDPGYSDEGESYLAHGSHIGNLPRASSRDIEIISQERLDRLAFLDPNNQNHHYLEMFEGPVDHLLLGAGRRNPVAEVFPRGAKTYAECMVCLLWTDLYERTCCAFHVCKSCLVSYFETQVSMANVKINCIGSDCSVAIHREEILALLDEPFRIKFNQFLVDANKNPRSKTCPRCSHIMTVDEIAALLSNRQIRTFGYRVECEACSLLWCFPCQAPWHEPIKCKVYQRGDKLLKNWAREQHYGQANAQKCPKCKVYIQRSSGCDHMTCSRCKTNFCYRCGEQFRELKFIGNHYSKLSIFGCKYRFLPENPVRRKLIRGSIFGGKLLAAPVLGGLAVGAGAVVIGVGALALPVYGAFKLHKKLQQLKRAKRQRRARDEMFRKLEEMHKRGEELDISNPITNTDIIAEIEASQIVADSFMRHSIVTSMFLSASDDDDADDDDDDSVYVIHMEQSSYDSDSSGVNDLTNLKLQNKSCQTSHVAGLNLAPELSLPNKNKDGDFVEGAFKEVDGRNLLRKSSRRCCGIVETHSMPQLDVCGRPPSPAYFMFKRPSHNKKLDNQEASSCENDTKTVLDSSNLESSESENLCEAPELFKINVDDSDCEECEVCYLCSVSIPKLKYDDDIHDDIEHVDIISGTEQYHNFDNSSSDLHDLCFKASPRNNKEKFLDRADSIKKDHLPFDLILKDLSPDTKSERNPDEDELGNNNREEVRRFSFNNHLARAKIFPLEKPTDASHDQSNDHLSNDVIPVNYPTCENSHGDIATSAEQYKAECNSVDSKARSRVNSLKHSSEVGAYVLRCSSSTLSVSEKDNDLCQKGDKSSSYILPCDFVIHL